MKKMLVLFAVFISQTSMAKDIFSLKRKEAQVSMARVVELVKLDTTEGIKVNLLVHDLGGSTDVSPTQEIYFNLYAKGEMYDTEAAFNLGQIYTFKSAKKLSDGMFEIKVSGVHSSTSMPVNKTFVIDAQKAIYQMKNVSCEDFDCPASTNFKSIIQMTTK